jgi:hypothetical protein
MKKEDLVAIKIRADKHLKKDNICFSDIENLCETVLQLHKENSLLRQNLFELEQQVPEEQQWHNVIANKLERASFFSGEKDFFEISNSINNVIYTISVQKKFGKSPVQLLRQSEIRRLKASQKVVNLHKERRSLEETCSRLKAEVFVLEKIGTPSLENEPLSREKLDISLKTIERVARSFNSQFYRRETLKLHISVREILHEALSRASQASYDLTRVKAENLKLRGAFLIKKHPICRIYKKRRKWGMKKRRLALH